MSEVRRRYKQTEVGVIPEDWEVVPLDSVAKRGSGHTPDKAHPEYWDGAIKWVSLQDSQQLDRLYIHETAAKITPAGIANSSAKMHPRGTVVLSRDAGVGRSAIMADDMAVSQHFMAWTCGQRLCNVFLYYWLQSQKPEFERIAMGNTIKTIGLPYFRKLRTPVPNRVEQEAIAEALSDADALIESLEQLLTKKRQIKQGAMQELLTGKKRLPGFQSRPGYKQTGAGLIPEDWAHQAFGRLYAEPSRNGIYKTAAYQGRGTRIVNMGEMFGYEFISNQDMSRVMLTPRELTISGLQEGDLLFGRRSVVPAGAGKCSLVLPPSEPLTFESSIIRVRLNGVETCPLFYYYFFASPKGRSTVGTIVSGTNIKGIRASELSELKVPLPARAEQESIAKALSDMDADITTFETKLTKARQIKQGMMQNLLTGKIRLV